jgi:hypothetical protein
MEKQALEKGEFEQRRSDVWVCVLCSRSNYWRLKQCRICKRPRVDVVPPPESKTAADGGGGPDAANLFARRRLAQQKAAAAASGGGGGGGGGGDDTGGGGHDTGGSGGGGGGGGDGAAGDSNNSSSSTAVSSSSGVHGVLTEFEKKEWMRRTEERIRDELEEEMKEQLHLLVSRYTRSKVRFERACMHACHRQAVADVDAVYSHGHLVGPLAVTTPTTTPTTPAPQSSNCSQ